MIILTAQTDNLQAVLAGSVTANQLHCMTSWRDVTTSTYTPGRTLALTNNVTDVNIVPAPGASTQRVVDYISVFNADTANQTVTVKLDANGTEYIIWKGVLGTGEKLEYTDKIGFQIFSNAGAAKMSTIVGNNPTSNALQTVVLGSDVVNNNATLNTIADVAGLSFAVTAGLLYYFEFVIFYTAAATTTGSRWTVNGPGSPTLLYYSSEYTLTAATQTVNYASAYDIPAASNASSLAAGNVAYISGFIKPSSNGTLIARFASEIANSAITAKAGSIVRYQQVA